MAIRVIVMYAPAPREVLEWSLTLPEGASVQQALDASGLGDVVDAQDMGTLEVAIWGRRAQLQHGLRDGDRVEACRPLRVDPKVARRERFRSQGARSAGLFAQRRPGGKAGY